MDILGIDNYINNYWKILILIPIVLIILTKITTHKSKKKQKFIELNFDQKGNARGIIFGKKGNKLCYSPIDSEGCCLVTAGTGMGKTSSVGIPTLRAWSKPEDFETKKSSKKNKTKGGNAFVIDISGDICRNCPDMPMKLIYEPEDSSTMPYNIFGVIDRIEIISDKEEALEQLAFLLKPELANASANSKFFDDNGRKIIAASLIAFYSQGMDFIPICEKVLSLSYIDLFKEIDKTENRTAMMLISSFVGASEQNTAGCKQSCDDALKLFATNAKIKSSIRRPNINEDCIEPRFIEDHNIFIIIDDPKLELYAPVLSIITAQLMQYISNRRVNENSKQILLFLDEYASLRIAADGTGGILPALRKFRKRKCRIMIMTQSIADLNILYSQEITKAILSNLRFKVLLGGLADTDSQKYFAEMIGYKIGTRHSSSKNAQNETHTKSEDREYIIEPADLDRQGKDVAILIHPDNCGWIKLRKNYYFK